MIDLFEESGTINDLDVIAICCEFTEADPDDIRENYSNIDSIRDSIDTDDLMDALNYYTYAVLLDNGSILYQDF